MQPTEAYFYLNNILFLILSSTILTNNFLPALLGSSCAGQQRANFTQLYYGSLYGDSSSASETEQGYYQSYYLIESSFFLIFFIFMNVVAWVRPVPRRFRRIPGPNDVESPDSSPSSATSVMRSRGTPGSTRRGNYTNNNQIQNLNQQSGPNPYNKALKDLCQLFCTFPTDKTGCYCQTVFGFGLIWFGLLSFGRGAAGVPIDSSSRVIETEDSDSESESSDDSFDMISSLSIMGPHFYPYTIVGAVCLVSALHRLINVSVYGSYLSSQSDNQNQNIVANTNQMNSGSETTITQATTTSTASIKNGGRLLIIWTIYSIIVCLIVPTFVVFHNWQSVRSCVQLAKIQEEYVHKSKTYKDDPGRFIDSSSESDADSDSESRRILSESDPFNLASQILNPSRSVLGLRCVEESSDSGICSNSKYKLGPYCDPVGISDSIKNYDVLEERCAKQILVKSESTETSDSNTENSDTGTEKTKSTLNLNRINAVLYIAIMLWGSFISLCIVLYKQVTVQDQSQPVAAE